MYGVTPTGRTVERINRSHGFAGSTAARDRAPGGVIDEVLRRGEACYRPTRLRAGWESAEMNLMGRRYRRFFSRVCEVGRAPGFRLGCRLGESAGVRVPYDG